MVVGYRYHQSLACRLHHDGALCSKCKQQCIMYKGHAKAGAPSISPGEMPSLSLIPHPCLIRPRETP